MPTSPAKSSVKSRKEPSAESPSTTVRLSGQAHAHLRELTARSGETMTAALGRLIEQGLGQLNEPARRQAFWEECEADYAEPASDPAAFAEYKAERAFLCGTPMARPHPTEVRTEADFVPGAGRAQTP